MYDTLILLYDTLKIMFSSNTSCYDEDIRDEVSKLNFTSVHKAERLPQGLQRFSCGDVTLRLLNVQMT